MKEQSVFAPYEDDTEQSLRLAFDQDIEYAKIDRLFKRTPEMYDLVKEKLFEHYEQIINIYNFYCGKSNYPRISQNDITSFCRDTGILDNDYIGFASLDLLLVATNVSTHKYK